MNESTYLKYSGVEPLNMESVLHHSSLPSTISANISTSAASISNISKKSDQNSSPTKSNESYHDLTKEEGQKGTLELSENEQSTSQNHIKIAPPPLNYANKSPRK